MDNETYNRKILLGYENIEEQTTKTTSVTTTSSSTKLQITTNQTSRRSSSSKESSSSPMRLENKEHSTISAASTTMSGPKIIDYGRDPELANARSRYMAWYKQKRNEMERKRKRLESGEGQQFAGGKKLASINKSRKSKEEGDKFEDDGKVLRIFHYLLNYLYILSLNIFRHRV